MPMNVTVEISFYPLIADFETAVQALLELLTEKPGITVETGMMSTLVSGKYDEVMALLSRSMKQLMSEYPSVFNIKIANACSIGSG
jgi:uncharacterized protein YqgV (UPF0045/DUF77 family)